jgi:hypothetical protein
MAPCTLQECVDGPEAPSKDFVVPQFLFMDGGLCPVCGRKGAVVDRSSPVVHEIDLVTGI